MKLFTRSKKNDMKTTPTFDLKKIEFLEKLGEGNNNPIQAKDNPYFRCFR
jgi:hypothetical protein